MSVIYTPKFSVNPVAVEKMKLLKANNLLRKKLRFIYYFLIGDRSVASRRRNKNDQR